MTTLTMNQRAFVGLAFIELKIAKFTVAAMDRKLRRLERSKERATERRVRAALRVVELEAELFI